MRRYSLAVGILIMVNAAVFAVAFLVQGYAEPMLRSLALYYPANAQFRPWQLLTSMFMHGSLPHIFFNMFALGSFGPLLEQAWGARRFLVFYFLCGVGSGLVYTGVNWIQFQSAHTHLIEAGFSADSIQSMLEGGRYRPGLYSGDERRWLLDLYSLYTTPVVGASGAIYGLLVAFGFKYPNARLAMMFVPVPIAAKYFIPGLIALDLLSGVTGISIFGGGIAHFAHVGGALIGFLLMLSWRHAPRSPTAAPESG